MKIYLKFYIFSILFTMCSLTEIFSQLQTSSFEFEGRNRYYKVFLPQNFQPNMPVVFNLHGYTLNAQWQINYTLMNNVADTAGFIAVYPDAVYPGFNGGLVGYPELPPIDTTINDVGFISVLIDTLAAHYNIDMNRVYCCGLSLGGIMTYRLACELNHRFAAVASVTGVLTDISGTNCNPMHPIPILHIHGTADAVVTYNGGIANLWSVDATLNLWIQNNNCLSPPDTVLLPDLDPNDGCTVQKISYTNCSDNSKIIFYKVIDGGHSWPGALTNPFAQSYPTNRDINASVEIWNFFKDYELVTSIKTIADHTPREFYLEQNYPNPFNPTTVISWQLVVGSSVNLSIYNVAGQRVSKLVNERQPAGFHSVEFDASQLASGVYFYRLEAGNQVETRKMVLMK
jgi:polyhydroxybutyrate depolymerase